MKIIYIIIMLYIFMGITQQKASAQNISVSFQVFYDDLSPYGTWVFNSNYGYVWIPDEAPGFTPYSSNGYWLFTDEGWTWVSYYSWGWAPFHYGRWYTDDIYGPMWIPGFEWGPAWVTWRRSEGYYGWAPMGPGININIAYGDGYNERYNHYTFVRCGYMGRREINKYYENYSNTTTIYNNSTVINNIREDKRSNVRYHAGPERADVEKRIGKTITPVVIKESTRPGQNVSKNQLQIYRPRVQNNTANGSKPAPSRVEDLKNVKTSAQRTSETPVQRVNKSFKQQSPIQQTYPQQNSRGGKQQPSQPQRKYEPAQQQSPQQQQNNPQQNSKGGKQQPSQPQRKYEPSQQQSPQQQQALPQQNRSGGNQQPSQPQRKYEPPKQQSPQQQQANPQQNRRGGKQLQPSGQQIKQQSSQPQRNNEKPQQQAPQKQQANPQQNKKGRKQQQPIGQQINQQPAQEQSEQRRTGLVEIYAGLAQNSIGVNNAFIAYVSGVKEIQIYLSNGMSNKGVEALAPTFRMTVNDGDNLKYAKENVQSAVESARAEMAHRGKQDFTNFEWLVNNVI